MNSHEHDPLKQLDCYVSFDPALDREAMGRDFEVHFGSVGDYLSQRYGTRDPSLVKAVPGMRPTKFVLRKLSHFERVECDSLPTAEGRWAHALAYALVRAELSGPLSTVAEMVSPPMRGQPLDREAFEYLAERVGSEALYEIGAVAYARSRLGPFDVPFAPLPLTSALEHVKILQARADSLARAASSMSTTSEPSAPVTTQDPPAPVTYDGRGDASAPESLPRPSA